MSDHAAALRLNSPVDGAICDTHLHIYDPGFAYDPDAVLQPPAATVAEYDAVRQMLGIQRNVIVQPTTYGFDNRCTLDAVARLGRANSRAVVVVAPTISEEALCAMHEAGACGVRINALRGATLDPDSLLALARRIAHLGWHVQLHTDGAALVQLAPWLEGLPTPVVIDHMGRTERALDPSSPTWRTLTRLLARPHVWVKLSAPYLLQPDGAPHYAALDPWVRVLTDTAGDRLLWGTDWPHPGWHAQSRAALDEVTLAGWAWKHLAHRGLAQAALVDNPARLYGF